MRTRIGRTRAESRRHPPSQFLEQFPSIYRAQIVECNRTTDLFPKEGAETSQCHLIVLDAGLSGVSAKLTSLALYEACARHSHFVLASSDDKTWTNYLRQHPYADIDTLLGDESLEIESVSYGSWVAVVRTKAKRAWDAIAAVATIFVLRVRDAYLKKLEADAGLKEIEAKRGAVALQRDQFELSKARAEHVVDLVNRVGDAETQKILQNRLRQSIYELASGDEGEKEIRANARRLLPNKGPDK